MNFSSTGSCEQQKKFFKTPKGFIRRRLGRLGRTIYDRGPEDCELGELEQEYREVDINPIVTCKRLNSGGFNITGLPGSSSTFYLEDSSKDVEGTISKLELDQDRVSY